MNFLKALYRKRRNTESYLRYVFSLLHMWLGLFVGIAIVLISATGAIYVFAAEYDDVENHRYLRAEQACDSMPSLDDAVALFKAKYNESPGGLYIPLDKQKNITLANRGRQNDRIKVYVDRKSGAFIAKAGNKAKVFNHQIISLHRWFMFKDLSKGRKWVGVSTFVLLFLLLSGLVMWFPRNLRTAKHAFKLKLKGKFKIINRQLHVNWGFYFTLLLMVLALSGVCITFPAVRQMVVKGFVQEDETIEKRMSKQDHLDLRSKYFSAEFSFDKMLAIADEVLAYESDRHIYFPSHHFKEYSVLAVDPKNFFGGAWADVVTFDLEGNYKTTYYFDEMPLHIQINQLIKPIHTGEIFGTKTKILYLILALFSAFLPISGFIIWWKKVVRQS